MNKLNNQNQGKLMNEKGQVIVSAKENLQITSEKLTTDQQAMMKSLEKQEQKVYGVASIDNLPFKRAANGTLILEIVVENETESGIILPDDIKQKMAIDVRNAKGLKWFKVLAVAPNLYPTDPNETHEIPSPGDYVTLKNGEKVIAFVDGNIFYGTIEWHQVMLVK